MRREDALRRRAEGQSFEEIGAALGVSRQRAYAIVRRALEAHAADFRQNVEAVRAGEALKLDRAAAALLPQVLAGNFRAQETWLKNRGAYARLLGLELQPAAHLSVDHAGPIYVLADPPIGFREPAAVDGEASELPELQPGA
jgi:hypothetical protein